MPRKKVIDTEVPPIIGMDSGSEPEKSIRVKKKVVLKNADGQKLTKAGNIDKRAESSLKNLQKSKVYQAIQQAKAAKKVPVIDLVESDESESDADEFEMTEIQIKKKSDPIIVEKEVIKEIPVEKEVIVEKIIEKEDVESKEELKKIKAENAKLKDTFQYNSHLNRISNMAKQVSIKF